MSVSAAFIRRPVATTLLTLGIALAGIDRLLHPARITAAAGGFPDHLRAGANGGREPGCRWPTTVATPLERHLGQIADVTEMTSSSSTGSSRITLQFGLDRDIDGAARDVEAAINAARADLPTSLRSNPTYRKVNPADPPDHDHGAHLEHPHARAALRCRRYDPRAEALAGHGHRPGADRRQLVARRPRRAQPERTLQVRHWPRGRAGGACRRQRQHAQGLRRCGRPALPDLRPTIRPPRPSST